MNIQFLCSGNRGVSPIIDAQAASLQQRGIRLGIVTIVGKGFMGYLRSVPKIRRQLKRAQPDLVHAHYALSGLAALLSTGKPVVTSLMGSDVINTGCFRTIINLCGRFLWACTIVKSEDMKQRIGLDRVIVLPNGVDTDKFKPLDKNDCRTKIGWTEPGKIILFAADPSRIEKNYALAEKAMAELNSQSVTMKVIYGVKHELMPTYLNAADLLVLTSLWEGSPNIVKEAMACNLPVVATDVGDIRKLFANGKSYRISKADPKDFAAAIRDVLESNERNFGRERIKDLRLDSASVADKLISIYNDVTVTRK